MKRIPLTHGQFALVDDEDFEPLMRSHWYAAWSKKTQSWRAMRNPNGSDEISMARAILGPKSDQLVDHRNHDTLDNQKHNLRICTTAQNAMNGRLMSNNTSGFKGVSWDKRRQRWRAMIVVAGKSRYIGNFCDILSAARAYDVAAREHFGEFALTNEQLGLLQASTSEYAIHLGITSMWSSH